METSSTGVPAAPSSMAWAVCVQSAEVTSWHCYFQLRAGICSSSFSYFSNFLVCSEEAIFLLSGWVSLVSFLHHHSSVTALESLAFTACFRNFSIMYFDMLPNSYNSKDQFGDWSVIFIIALENTECLFIIISSSDDFLIFFFYLCAIIHVRLVF